MSQKPPPLKSITLALGMSLTELKAQRPLRSGDFLALTLIKPHIVFADWILLPLITWLRGWRRFLLGLAGLAVLIVGISAVLLPGWWQRYLTGAALIFLVLAHIRKQRYETETRVAWHST
jgi:hypothetical protein